MKNTLSLAASMVMLVLLSACQNAPIEDYENLSLRAKGNPTVQQVGDFIQAMAEGRGWKVKRTSPGVIDATLVRREGKHTMDITITYDTDSFSIYYVTSSNMNYSERDGVRRIHPNYNRWIGFLRGDIEFRSDIL